MARRVLPWQQITSKHQFQSTSAKELMREAGLDWNVSLEQVVVNTDNEVLPVENKWATVRNNNDGSGVVLGMVGSRYKIFQNEDVFTSLDFLVDSGEARYSSAGELQNGAIVWAVMELPEAVSIANDPHAGYLLARTSHDGSTAFQIAPIVSRLGCTNQMNAAFARADAGVYSLKHTTNNNISIQDLRSVINIMYEDFNSYELMANDLMGQSMTDGEFSNFTRKMFPISTKIEFSEDYLLSAAEKRIRAAAYRNRSAAWLVWDNGTETQEHLRNTKFGALHAIIEVADHFGRSQTKTSSKVILSKDGAIKNRALQLLKG